MRTNSRSLIRIGQNCSILAGLLLAVASCDDSTPKVTQKTIGTKREVDTSGKSDELDVSTVKRMGFKSRSEDDTSKPGGIRDLFAVTVPPGWKELPPAQFRDINFAVGPNGDVACYLTYLQGDGGGARQNVDRWRKQFGLAPATDAEYEKLAHVKLLGRDSVLASLAGSMVAMGQASKDGQAMVGVFAEFPAFGITVKIVGPKDIVDGERKNFDEFVAKLAFNPGAIGGAGSAGASETAPPPASVPTPPVADGAFDPTKVKWQAPQGWTTGSGSSMRLVTLEIPGGAECWVTPLAGGAGGLKANLDRWRKEMGQEALSESDIAGLPKLKVLGLDSPWLDLSGAYKGMGGPKSLPATARMFAAACAMPDALVSIKMVGTPETLEKERSNFIAFCQSLEVGK